MVDHWLQETLEAPGEGVRRVLRRAYRDDEEEAGPRAALRKAVRSLAEWRDFNAPWRRDAVDRRALIAGALEAIHAFAAVSAKGAPNDNFYKDTAPIRRFSRLHTAPIPDGKVGEETLDALEALLGPLSRDKAFTRCQEGYGSSYAAGVPRAEVKAAHAALKDCCRSRWPGSRPISRRACSRNCSHACTLRGGQAGARRTRFHRPADARARPAPAR